MTSGGRLAVGDRVVRRLDQGRGWPLGTVSEVDGAYVYVRWDSDRKGQPFDAHPKHLSVPATRLRVRLVVKVDAEAAKAAEGGES